MKKLQLSLLAGMDKKNILQNLCYTPPVYGRINKKLKLGLSNDAIEGLMLEVIKGCDTIEKIGKKLVYHQ